MNQELCEGCGEVEELYYNSYVGLKLCGGCDREVYFEELDAQEQERGDYD